ncbi:uncharacterized protein LOC128199817 [Bicyclus anynana]|uniref:Uncharacterized protein LOC128199817 n=1 Tax=Bicyclus anynana TaxID=110368 RepID=A0ABM3M639_BICAN|nr:uncharacterized protein LOC128199817 [Bicyclus anynana]
MSSKLDNNTIGKWEERRNNFDEVPTLKQFNKFLSDRADVLETLNRNKNDKLKQLPRPMTSSIRNYNNYKNYNNSNNNNELKSFAATFNTNSYRCSVCKNHHRIYDCPIFLAKSVGERKTDVSRLRLCFNCLRGSHSLRFCRSGSCRTCNELHNTLLCTISNKHDSVPTSNRTTKNTTLNVPNNNVVNCSTSIQNTNQIILSTALITVTNPKTNQIEKVKALLDCGSQSTFISQSLKQKLSLDSEPINTINIIGIGNTSCDEVTETCTLQLGSINKDFNIQLTCYVMKQLTGQIPKIPINIQQLQIPTDIQLADPTFDQPAPIEVLIGADIFWDILGCEQHSFGPNNPKLRSSKFGRLEQWFLANEINDTDDKSGVKRRAILLSSLAETTFKLIRDLALPNEVGSLSYQQAVSFMVPGKNTVSPLASGLPVYVV